MIRSYNFIIGLLFISVIIISSCALEEETIDPIQGDNTPPNILLIIADDMGKDATNGYSEGSIKPNTPTLSQLQNEGLVFTKFWVNPTCSPTRASIITGKNGYRTGVTEVGEQLSTSERILHRYIKEGTSNAYSTGLIGKWHLSGNRANTNPETWGMDYYAGIIGGGVQDYYNWELTEDGGTTQRTDYVTEALTELAIDWVNDQEQPWFLWLAYNAPHTPFHLPPTGMHAQGDLPEYTDAAESTPYYMAAIEAMDFQINRLINNIPSDELENTIIIFITDNGTPNQVVQAPYDERGAKGRLFQGGINVPMTIAGKGVSRRGLENSLVTNTDLYSTIADIAGVENADINDSQSFKSLLSSSTPHDRAYQYTELGVGDDAQWAISDGIYKLIESANGTQRLFKLIADPYEEVNLIRGTLDDEASQAKTDLEQELARIRQ